MFLKAVGCLTLMLLAAWLLGMWIRKQRRG